MKKFCMSCGNQFDAREEYHKVCWPCWKKGNAGIRQEAIVFDAEKSRLMDEIIYWKELAKVWEMRYIKLGDSINDELFTLETQIESLRYELSHNGIQPEMLKRLIYLCHPDKHNGSDVAKNATTWLLQRRPS